jgi:toxin-antitoxin system PIN domain toxin
MLNHPRAEQHEKSRVWLEGVLSGPDLVRFAWLTLWAFLRIATNPRVFDRPLSTSEAEAAISCWLAQPAAGILEPGERHWDILSGLVRDAQAVGPLVLDAVLAAIAIEHGATVCTTTFRGSPRSGGRTLLRREADQVQAEAGGCWLMGVCARVPWLINKMPERTRLRLAYTKGLGPLGGAFMRERFAGIPTLLGRHITEIKARDKVYLKLRGYDKKNETVTADHVVFATGYKPDVSRLGFLDPQILAQIRRTITAPRLSRHYESSVPGLHFIGPAAAPSFGPVCRFVYGSFHPARHLSA